MPELPEVETVRTELEMHITGKTIAEIDLRRGNIRIPIPDLSGLYGKRIKSVDRRAKYLIIHFHPSLRGAQRRGNPGSGAPALDCFANARNDDDALVIHLGMSGKILLGRDMERKKHDHVIFHFSDGSEMAFNDARRFGIVTLRSLSDDLFVHLGPEPFSDNFSSLYLYNKLKTRKSPIKPALMDQRLVVGVGNIYASEALFRTHLNPKTPANKIPKPKLAMLIKNIRAVLQEAIESGGSTLRDYVRSSGDTGYFQHKFDVYGKNGKPCPNCKTPITKITQAGRSTFYCQKCQK